jgi:predicted RNA-binding protein YlqC (UPF0109 family)
LTLPRQETNPMKEFLIEIVQAVVDNPEEIEITEIKGTQTTVLELRVAEEDMGKVIGKQGRMANAIRTILNAASGKTGKRHMLEIVE